MKICVSAQGPGLDAQVDPRFGRCQYFTLVDADTMEHESIENTAMSASGGAGIQAGQLVGNRGIEVVLTGNVGPNAYATLQAAGVKVITGVRGTVREVVETFKTGNAGAFVSGPTVQAHTGTGGPGQATVTGQGLGGRGGGMGQGAGMGQGRGMGRGMGKGRGGGGGGRR